MGLIDYVILASLLLILGGAALYLRKAKKKGKKCAGCPYSGSCGGSCK